MCHLDESVSNLDWMKIQIHKAKSRERLDYIAELIDYCKWDEEEWTRDEQAMTELRQLWKDKAIELANG